MAGTDPRFPSAQFREGILFAMNMAKPNAVEELTTFYRDIDGTYVRTDPAGKPYAWDTSPLVNPSREEVVVPCSVEYTARVSMADVTSVGEFNLSRAAITVFADGYEQIKDIQATHVKIGGSTYRISSVSPPDTLFDQTFYTISAEAIDEA